MEMKVRMEPSGTLIKLELLLQWSKLLEQLRWLGCGDGVFTDTPLTGLFGEWNSLQNNDFRISTQLLKIYF